MAHTWKDMGTKVPIKNKKKIHMNPYTRKKFSMNFIENEDNRDFYNL